MQGKLGLFNEGGVEIPTKPVATQAQIRLKLFDRNPTTDVVVVPGVIYIGLKTQQHSSKPPV